MNLSYLLPPLVAAAIGFSLLIVVLRHRPKNASHWVLFFLLLSTTLWALAIFAMRNSSDIRQALFWDRTVPFTGFAVPLLFYHFSFVLARPERQRVLLRVGYFVLVLVLALSPTTVFVERMEMQPYGFAPIFGPGIYLIFTFGYLLSFAAIYNLLKAYRTSTKYKERNRLLYITTAMFFPVLGGLFEAFPTFYPTAIFGNIAFGVFTTIAIVKYRLLDIRIIARKGLSYLLVSIVVAIPYVGALVLLNQVLKQTIEPWWVHIIIVLLLAILLRPLYSWVQQLVDRLFYRDRYDYLRTLERFSREAQSIVSLKELGSTLVKLVSGALHTSSACLLLVSEGSGSLTVASCVGLDNPPRQIVIRGQSLLMRWLKVHGHILSSRELNIFPGLQSLSLREKNNLEQMGAKLFVPIKSRENELSGVLVLGQKLSRQTYSDEDKRLLTAVSNQMAMALNNARLYNDALRARENLETWLNSMSDCVMIASTDHTIQFMNKAAVEKFGSRAGEICWNVLGKDAECSNCPMQRYLSDNNEGSHYINNVGGREYDVAAAPLSNADGSLSIIEVLRDVTERKRMEEREKQLQQELNLSGRLASIGQLAAGVAHEINNPLTGILGFSQRLLRRSADKEVSRDLERIHNEALRAAKVVQNLLTFARRREPKKQYSDINDIVQKALELRAYELKTSNIEVITDLTPNLPQVVVDFHQIQEVFLNIILNAEQAVTGATGGGKLSIKTQQIKGYIGISFTDDGLGIPAEHLDKLFDPFFTTRGETGGTGLGLSICHGIVTEHGGRIYVKSKPKKGATFFVELPIMSETVAESRGLRKRPSAGANKHGSF